MTKGIKMGIKVLISLVIRMLLKYSRKIYIVPAGQLGNNFRQIGHLAAFAMEHKLEVVCPGFDLKYGRHFEKSLSSWHHRVISRFLRHYLFKDYVVSFDREATVDTFYNSEEKELIEGKVRVATGFYYRNPPLFRKYHNAIMGMFAFKKEYLTRVKERVASLKEEGYLLLGVHIRRSDYKEYRGGIFYYDDETYQSIIGHLLQSIDQRCIIVICSDEEIDVDSYRSVLHNDVMQNSGGMIEDMLMLSHSDYILGVPSTFSHWASLIGQTPLCFIGRKDVRPHLDDFKVQMP